MSIYELAILGSPTVAEEAALRETLAGLLDEFALQVGDQITIHSRVTVPHRTKAAAFAAAYFAGNEHADLELVSNLLRSSAPIIPTLRQDQSFEALVPPILHHLNGSRRHRDDVELKELAVALLECVGLLRRQRRVFVSYRRPESREAAMQLHDLLSARVFDVFLDTHDIRPGEPFQEVLWHRLCDSDVLIMLDTATYFDRKWTRQELGRARAKEIHVLRVVWPDNRSGEIGSFADTIYLDRDDLVGATGPIREGKADEMILKVEMIRSRSIASRYMSITGKLCAEVEKIGGEIDGVGAHRAVSITLPYSRRRVWAYPIVGIPTAELLNDVAEKARRANQEGTPALVYDHVGIGEQWATHLQWLDENIEVVKAVRVSEAGWTLNDWDD